MTDLEERLIGVLEERRPGPIRFFCSPSQVGHWKALGAILEGYVDCEDDGETWQVAQMRSGK